MRSPCFRFAMVCVWVCSAQKQGYALVWYLDESGKTFVLLGKKKSLSDTSANSAYILNNTGTWVIPGGTLTMEEQSTNDRKGGVLRELHEETGMLVQKDAHKKDMDGSPNFFIIPEVNIISEKLYLRPNRGFVAYFFQLTKDQASKYRYDDVSENLSEPKEFTQVRFWSLEEAEKIFNGPAYSVSNDEKNKYVDALPRAVVSGGRAQEWKEILESGGRDEVMEKLQQFFDSMSNSWFNEILYAYKEGLFQDASRKSSSGNLRNAVTDRKDLGNQRRDREAGFGQERHRNPNRNRGMGRRR